MLDYLPDVAITSYLGDTAETRKRRLDLHIRQRQILDKSGLTTHSFKAIVSICSGYSKAERKALDSHQAIHFKERMPKWQKQNLVLELLYKSDRERCVLFLDDDIVPRPITKGNAKNGLVDAGFLCDFWLANPSQTYAPLTYFSCASMRQDAFYKSQEAIIGKSPIGITGWAMLVRNDLGVLHDSNFYAKYPNLKVDDFSFRVMAEAAGKLAIKHNRAFFKALGGTSGEDSTIYQDQDDRKTDIREALRILRQEYPDVFTKTKKKQPEKPGLGLLKGKT